MLQRRALAMLVLALLLAAVPTAAQAKGASAATISGGGPGGLPGGPIDLAGDGEPGSGTGLANLAEAAGVFALLFEDGGQSGELAVAPAAGERGPRYTITWTFPNGAGAEDKVRQSVWPYAAGGPITYMAPASGSWTATTKGGWYRPPTTSARTLITLGLPDRQPSRRPSPKAARPRRPRRGPGRRGPGRRPGPGAVAEDRPRGGAAPRRGRRRRAGPAPPFHARPGAYPLGGRCPVSDSSVTG